jgi:hypothetical protein
MPGTPLTLTIDSRIQFAAERELVKAWKRHARTGSIVVMNPYNGRFWRWRIIRPSIPTTAKPGEDPPALDLAVSMPFEPRSVFKVVTWPRFGTTDLRPDSPINCNKGVLRLPAVIHIRTAVTESCRCRRCSKIEQHRRDTIGFRVGPQNMRIRAAFRVQLAHGPQLPADRAACSGA